MELFLSKVKDDIFSVLPGYAKKFNLNRVEYLTIGSLQNGRCTIIQPADKGSAIVFGTDRIVYKRPNDRSVIAVSIRKLKVTEKNLVDLVNKVHKIFGDLERRNIIQEKEKNF